MLQNTDLIILLSELDSNGVSGAKELIPQLIGKTSISMEALKFISEHRPLDVSEFYERIRKNYNDKRSNLYKNIVREIDDSQEVLTTLHALALQIILYSKHVEDKNVSMFFKHTRAEEITRVLNNYYKTYDIISARRLLALIKADLVAFEYIAGRRTND